MTEREEKRHNEGNPNPYERRSDAVIQRVEQKIDDHMVVFNTTKSDLVQWQLNHVEWCKAEVKRLEDEMAPMRTAFRKFETPVRWVGWIIVGTVTGALLWIGEKIMMLISRHWNG